MVVEQYSWKPLSEGHEENTHNVDVCCDWFVFFFFFFFFFFFLYTYLPKVHYNGFTDNLLSTCMCVWVQCCVGYDCAWVFAYMCCARTPEREWTTECPCLFPVGKVHLFNSHLHICLYGGGTTTIWQNICLCRQMQYSLLSTFTFFWGGGAYVWVRVIIFSECKYLEHFTSIKFTVASHILSLRFHFPLQLKDHSEPILVTCRFLSVSYRKIVIRLHQIRSTAVSQTSSLPTVDTLKSMQRKVSSWQFK